MAASNGRALPVVDLAPFFVVDDKDGVALARGRATEAVREACMSSGFFRVVNHGVPRELMARCLELSAAFFALPDDEKAKVRTAGGSSSLPAGYARQPPHAVDKNETLLVLHPKLWLDLYPDEPAGFREALVEIHAMLTDLGLLIQEILNECLCLPRGFLGEYNDDRGFDFISSRHYFPATEEENSGTYAHQDANIITFVLQDHVGGLEGLGPEGDWSPVEPVEDSLIVNIGDAMQVLSNDKFRSVMHRVVRKPAAHRYSLVFFFNVHGDKWVEPLAQLAGDVGEPPRYRGFQYSEYVQLRMRNKTHPPSRPEDAFDITHYAI